MRVALIVLAGCGRIGFGALSAASFTVNSDTSISVVTPAAPTGGVPVVVVAPGGTSTVSGSTTYTFSATTSPSIRAPCSGGRTCCRPA